jgi:hypothetical protein
MNSSPSPMETKPGETEISSLRDFSNHVADLCSNSAAVWFRGARKASYGLVPSLYRHSIKKSAEELRQLESDLMGTFRDRAPPFTSQIPTVAMEMLFLMQHHGVPTRLLDWTENPYVALFFALEVNEAGDDAAVWTLDPVSLNKTALANNTGSDRVLAANDELLNAYQPGGQVKSSGKLPVAMYGVHNSRRIVAQRGVFVLFGTSTTPMESNTDLSPALMKKLVIPAAARQTIFKALHNMGVTDSVVYPDLDGLGREIKNRYGY